MFCFLRIAKRVDHGLQSDKRDIRSRGDAHSISRMYSVIILAVVLLSPNWCWAHAFTIDQANDLTMSTGGYTVPGFGPVGQEFTPILSSLDSVEMLMNKQALFGSVSAFVRIREESMTGTILGTSSVVPITNFGAPSVIYHFDFATSVPLVPSAKHVIEVVRASGSIRLGVSTAAGFVDGDTYLGGSSIHHGSVDPTTDLWFREGLAGGVLPPTPGGGSGSEIPEPLTGMLGLMSLVALGTVMRRSSIATIHGSS